MNTVYPIKDFELISKIKNDLSHYRSAAGKRRYLLFCCGIYLGLRISDILKLKVGDLTCHDILIIREQKTGKQSVFPINEDLKRIIKREFKNIDLDMLIFSTPRKKGGAISRRTAYNDIQAIFRPYGINYAIGTHTLRKTFGYTFYKMCGDISMLMLWFNHDNIDTTKRYIGIDVDERANAIKKFKL